VKLQRVDRLKEPPVIGQTYLVPTVFGQWHHLLRDWPVIGLKHDDIEHLNFDRVHYHLDTRFLRVSEELLYGAPYRPLHARGDVPLGPVKLARRKMIRAPLSFDGPAEFTVKFDAAFAGQQCGKGKRGWVCPHKHFPLGSIESIDGVLKCPLHGLRIDAATGRCLSHGEVPAHTEARR
jgi:hypothetical protein